MILITGWLRLRALPEHSMFKLELTGKTGLHIFNNYTYKYINKLYYTIKYCETRGLIIIASTTYRQYLQYASY